MTELKTPRKPPILGATPLIWDNASVNEPASGICITATDQEFNDIGTFLLTTLALRWPDPSNTDDREGEWDNFNEPLRNAAQRIALQMLSRLIVCGIEDTDMKLRQKPDNPCVLQQQQGEDGWVDVFDYEACLLPALDNVFAEAGQAETDKDLIEGSPLAINDLWQRFQDTYTGTSESFDPDLVLTGDDEHINRAGLCKAVGLTVRRYVAQSVKVKSDAVEGIGRVVLAIGIGMAIMALLVAFPVILTALPALLASYLTAGNLAIAGAVLGLNAVGLQVWIQNAKDVDLAVLNDESAISDIICIWYSNMKGETDISDVKFAEELDVSGESANTQALYAVLKPLIEQPVAYPAFLVAWKKEINLRSLVAESYCECDDPTPTLVTVSPYLFALEYEGKEGDDDVWIFQTGFTGAQNGAVLASGVNHFELVSLEMVSGSESSYEYQLVSPLDGYHYFADPALLTAGASGIEANVLIVINGAIGDHNTYRLKIHAYP